jgi:hypothetical protein
MGKNTMKYLITILLIVSNLSYGAALNIQLMQRKADDSGNDTRLLPTPASNGIIYYNTTTNLPGYLTLGTGLSINSAVISSTGWADWTSITNKPTFATIATSGAYSDLTGIPSTFASTWSLVSGKPSFATVATSGSYSDLSGRPSLATVATSGLYADLNGKPTTLSGYGITDAYPLSGNPSGFLTSINSSQVTTALGFTPYNTTNPNGYVNQSGARTSISLTTIGTGAASYNSSNGVINVPTPPSVTPFNFGSPNARTVSAATAYQCTDTAKPCVVTLTVTCPLTLSILAGATCAGEVRIGSNNTVATGGGTNIAPINRNASGIIGLSTNDNETKTITVPAGWFFAIRQTTGTGMTIVAVFDQSAG